MPFFRRMHVRLTLLVLSLFLATFAGTFIIVQRQSFDAALETTQRQNIRLASYIASIQPRDLINTDGQVDAGLMRMLARNVRNINPSLEVYLLDARGRVIAHALGGARTIVATVGLQTVRALALPSIAAPTFPVLGDDPSRPGQTGIFSAAAIGRGTEPEGYLYLMLNSANMLPGGSTPVPDTLRTAGLGLLAIMLLAAGMLTWLVRHLTRPLSQLTRSVQAFRTGAQSMPSSTGQDEIMVLKHSVDAMQSRIAQQFAGLERQDQIRRELISNVSHDLHTPLTNMRGYLETLLLRDETLSGKQRREYLNIVLQQSQRLSKRINTLFELSKLDAGQVVPRPESFCLAEVLQDVLVSYRLKADEKDVTLNLDVAGYESAMVCADIALLDRVLQNLIDNALRHTPQAGQVNVAITDDKSCGQQLRVSITNSGGLIAQEHLRHIFERYWQGQGANQAEVSGSHSAGLGLAIVKRILDLHGSTIEVASDKSFGTRFEFSLEQP